MTLYMHVILFFICINFGLGITTIPNTPLTLSPPEDQTGNPLDLACFHSFQSAALITPALSTNNGFHAISTTYPDNNENGIADDYWGGWQSTSTLDSNGNPTGANLNIFYDGNGSPLTSNMTGGFNPITEAIEASYNAGETLKNVFLGGYITTILGSLSMECDTDPASNNYGSATVSPVMSYMIYFVNIVFGIMLVLALIYLITGKSFGF